MTIHLTLSDDQQDNLVAKAAAGCCGDVAWRGRLCNYHQGIEDGVAIAVQAIAELAAAALGDELPDTSDWQRRGAP